MVKPNNVQADPSGEDHKKRNNNITREFYYRKRGSVSCIVREVRSVCVRERERERCREGERERDGSDVTIVALKLAIGLHIPLPKIRTFRFSLHTSRLSILKAGPPLRLF